MYKSLFTIPIFLRSKEQYYKERENAENKIIAERGEFCLNGKRRELWWPPWEVNDIVGYITVDYGDSQYIINRMLCLNEDDKLKRLSRDPKCRKKMMLFSDGCWELKKPLSKNISNKEAKKTLTNALYEAKNHLPRKEWFINLDYYNNLIYCLDLKKFLPNETINS